MYNNGFRSALARFFKQRALSNKEGSESGEFNLDILKIVFLKDNFQIDLNMSCDGAKEEIKKIKSQISKIIYESSILQI